MDPEKDTKKTDEINHKRTSIGLPKLHHIWCNICKTLNDHVWYDCKSLFCPLSHGNHPIWSWYGDIGYISRKCYDRQGI